MAQARHPRQLPPTHSGAAVVSSFPPTPSSSSTLLPSPTGGTEGIDPKPNRTLVGAEFYCSLTLFCYPICIDFLFGIETDEQSYWN